MNTIDLYLNESPISVVRTHQISDVACGMYPCYYIQRDSEVWVSTSAASLIAELGSVRRNEAFDMPEFITSLANEGTSDEGEGRTLLERLASSVPHPVTSRIQSEIGDVLPDLGLLSSTTALWRDKWDTIDRRVRRLRPFETVRPGSSGRTFNLTYSLDNVDTFVEKTADHIQRFVNDVEEQFPHHDHIIMMGKRQPTHLAGPQANG